MYGTINQYPWVVQKKPLKKFFTALNLKPEYYSCEQSCGDLMYNIFDGWEGSASPTRVLLFGSPGTGKTTLCQKYVYDWANSGLKARPPFDQFKVVVFLKLNDLKGTLEEIMEGQVFCNRLTPEERQMFFSYMREHPEVFLFILDGINECNLDELPDIKNFLEDKSYKGVFLIATSRPELTSSWMDLYNHFHAHFRVKGYSNVKVLEFIGSYLKENEEAQKLREHIQASSNLMKLGKIPLLTPIICELWKESHKLPTLPTMTKLLNYFVIVVVRLFCFKKKIEWNSESCQHSLDCLGKLALDGVMRNSMQYTLHELQQHGVDQTLELGFLGAKPQFSNPIKDKGFHCFAHKSIQEFLATKWLVKNWSSTMPREVATMLEDVNIAKFHSILVFIAGLLSNEPDKSLLSEFIQRLSTSSCQESFLEKGHYCYRMQILLECCYEAWQEESGKCLKSSVVTEVIQNQIEGINLFTKVITPGAFPPIMSSAELEGLSLIITTMKLSTLDMSGILLQENKARILADKCLKNNCFLKCVKFSNCCLSPHAVETICLALESMPKLEIVDLSRCNLSDKGLTAVAHLLENSKSTIRTLQLGDYCDRRRVQQVKDPLPGQHCGVQMQIKELSAFQEQCTLLPPSDCTIQDLIHAIEEETCELQEISLLCCHIGNMIKNWLNAFDKKDSLRKIR